MAQREGDAPTRDRVARTILENGPSTAADLADRLALTPAAVRRHLDHLGAEGVVESREQKVYGARGPQWVGSLRSPLLERPEALTTHWCCGIREDVDGTA